MPITKKRGVFYYRKQIHQSIRHLMPSPWTNKSNIIISLKTKKLTIAEHLMEQLDLRINPIIQGCFESIGKSHTKADGSIIRRIDAMMGVFKTPQPTQHAITPQPTPEPKPTKVKHSIKKILAAYMDLHKPAKTTELAWLSAWNQYIQTVGLNWESPITKVTKSTIIEFINEAIWMPAYQNKSIYKDKTFQEMIEMVKDSFDTDEPLPRVKAKTVNGKLDAISAVCNHCVKYEYLESNPTSGLRLPENDSITREIYTDEDIKNIYSHQSFKEPKANWNDKQWILICATMGLRANETASLLVEDVRVIDGVPCIVLSELDLNGVKKKELKTKDSWRTVPIHKDIIELGFMDYVKRIKESGAERLFPDLLPVYNNYAHSFSKWYGLQREDFGITSPTKVFHCFRHTFKTLCSRYKVPEVYHDTLSGHAQPSVSRGYIHPTIADLKAAMDAVDFGLLKYIKNAK